MQSLFCSRYRSKGSAEYFCVFALLFYFHQQYPKVDLLMIEFVFIQLWNLAVHNATVN